MKLLQYKSNEMFSATQLIRKSKMVFDKIVNDEIDKAIILRDGKPTFLLMDFAKYENIMAEYEELKELLKDMTPKKKKKKKIKKDKTKEKLKNKPALERKPELEKKIQKEPQKEITIKVIEKPIIKKEVEITLAPTFPLPVDRPKNKIESAQIIEKQKPIQINKEIIKEENKKEIEIEPTQEEELSEAMKNLDNINLDDDMKKIAQAKVKERILQARQLREKQKEEELKILEEEEQKEKEISVKIEQKTQEKQEALSDFWA